MPCDYRSRHPPPRKTRYTKLERERLGIESEEEYAEIWINMVQDHFNHAITTNQLREETAADEELSKLLKELETNTKSSETSKGPYGKIYRELMEWNGIVRRGTKVAMPKSLQPRAIAIAHEGHQAADKTLTRLRKTTWFRGSTKQSQSSSTPATQGVR